MSLYSDNLSFDKEEYPHTPVFAKYDSVADNSFLEPISYRKKVLQIDTPETRKYRIRKILNSEVSVRANKLNKLMSPGCKPWDSPEQEMRSLSTSNNERYYLSEINHLNLKIKSIIRDKEMVIEKDLSKYAEGRRNEYGLNVTFKPRAELNRGRRFPKEVFCMPNRYRLH